MTLGIAQLEIDHNKLWSPLTHARGNPEMQGTEGKRVKKAREDFYSGVLEGFMFSLVDLVVEVGIEVGDVSAVVEEKVYLQ